MERDRIGCQPRQVGQFTSHVGRFAEGGHDVTPMAVGQCFENDIHHTQLNNSIVQQPL